MAIGTHRRERTIAARGSNTLLYLALEVHVKHCKFSHFARNRLRFCLDFSL